MIPEYYITIFYADKEDTYHWMLALDPVKKGELYCTRNLEEAERFKDALKQLPPFDKDSTMSISVLDASLLHGSNKREEGFMLPTNEIEFEALAALDLVRYTECTECSKRFSSMNTVTADGWRETQISGLCEDCFDDLCAEGEKQ